MNHKHTPGPWHVIGYAMTDGPTVFDVQDESDNTICFMPRRSDANPVPNAHLIAAAPDLLTAVQDLLEGLFLRGLLDGWVHDPEMISRARAAVAKAENK